MLVFLVKLLIAIIFHCKEKIILKRKPRLFCDKTNSIIRFFGPKQLIHIKFPEKHFYTNFCNIYFYKYDLKLKIVYQIFSLLFPKSKFNNLTVQILSSVIFCYEEHSTLFSKKPEWLKVR